MCRGHLIQATIAIVLATGGVGCATRDARVSRLEAELQRRDQYIQQQKRQLRTLAMSVQHLQRPARNAREQPAVHAADVQSLLSSTRALLRTNKELVESNEELRRRLTRVEQALAQSEAKDTTEPDPSLAEGTAVAPLHDPPSDEEIEMLVRDVNYLVERGVLKVVTDASGNLRFVLPRRIMTGDPWL